MDNQKAVLYLRVSTKAQGYDDRDGLPRQRALLREYAEQNGLEVVEEFTDHISGGTEAEGRKGWMRMISHLHNDGVRIILVESLNRLARDLMIQELLIRDLQKAGFTLRSLSDNDLCSEDPHRKFMRQVLGAASELERALIKARTAHNKKAGIKPFGQLPGEDVILARMKELRAQGNGHAQIAATLNAEGLKPRGRVRNNKLEGESWGETGIAKILRRHK